MDKKISNYQNVDPKKCADRKKKTLSTPKMVTLYGNITAMYRPQYYCKIILE